MDLVYSTCMYHEVSVGNGEVGGVTPASGGGPWMCYSSLYFHCIYEFAMIRQDEIENKRARVAQPAVRGYSYN